MSWDQSVDMEEGDVSEMDALPENELAVHLTPKISVVEILRQYDGIRDSILFSTPDGKITFYKVCNKKGVWLCEVDRVT